MNPLLQKLISGLPADSPLATPAKPAIAKVSYNHEAMVNMIVAEPWISQNELARRFGMSASWISTIICSDLFQARLAARREDLVDPEVRSSLKLQFEGLLSRSMEVLRHKLDLEPDQVPDRLAVEVAKMAGKNLGLSGPPVVSVQETHVHLEELGNNLVGLLRRRRAENTYEADYQGNPQQQGGSAGSGSALAPLEGQLPAGDQRLLPAREDAALPGAPGLPG